MKKYICKTYLLIDKAQFCVRVCIQPNLPVELTQTSFVELSSLAYPECAKKTNKEVKKKVIDINK